MKFEKNTELDQANLRLIVATCAILYVVLIGLLVENLVFGSIERLTVKRWGVQR
mgnify:CR=1 FL=1